MGCPSLHIYLNVCLIVFDGACKQVNLSKISSIVNVVLLVPPLNSAFWNKFWRQGPESSLLKESNRVDTVLKSIFIVTEWCATTW